MRTLVLNDCYEWRALRNVARPPGVPSHPYHVYADKYAGMRDWLGLPARPVPTCRVTSENESFSDSEADDLPALAGSPNMHKANVGIRNLMLLAAEQFVFFRMPRFSRIHVLYQPRDTPDPTLWGALSVQMSSTEIANAGGGVSFNVPSDNGVCAIPHARVFFDSVNGDFFISDEVNVTCLTLRRGRGAKYDSSYVESHAVAGALGELYRSKAGRTQLEWLRSSGGGGREMKRMAALVELWSTIFAPLGVGAQFPEEVAFHNLEIDGAKVVFRVCCAPKSGRSGWPYKIALLKSWKPILSRKPSARYSVDDDFSFLLVCLMDDDADRLLGVFLFPKRVLDEKCVLVSPKSVGMETFTLYPPVLTTKLCPLGRVKQDWQSDFYIDLTDPTKAARAADRFSDILTRKNSSG